MVILQSVPKSILVNRGVFKTLEGSFRLLNVNSTHFQLNNTCLMQAKNRDAGLSERGIPMNYASLNRITSQ